MLGCKGLIPFISLEQFFFYTVTFRGKRVMLGLKISVESLPCKGYFLWMTRQNARLNTGSVFPLWYLLTQKSYHVKVSFQCVALLMLHPLEFIDINYMKLFEFPRPQFSLYNFHLWYCSIFLYFCIFPYTNYSFVFLNLLIFSHLPTVFSPCCPVK